MNNTNYAALDPKLDLSFERIVDVPKELIWKAWTTPKHLMPWFCPLPWHTIACEIDLRIQLAAGAQGNRHGVPAFLLKQGNDMLNGGGEIGCHGHADLARPYRRTQQPPQNKDGGGVTTI